VSITTLRLRTAPALRLDLRALNPAALAGLSASDIGRLSLPHGKGSLPLAECFDVQLGDEPDALRLEGELSRCDRIGWLLAGGRIEVQGSVGDYAGACMTAGALHVHGSARDLAACEMAGGTLTIEGSLGDFAASTLPGSMDGMRGGTLIVRGSAGARFGDRMRRGTALVFGDAGDFIASRMVAGTIAVGGRCGAHPAYGMRRGSLVFAGPAPQVPATFVPAGAEAPVFWQLLARDLQVHGGPFTGLAARRMQRHLGDVCAAGKGEILLAPATI
jgi:formylmethanofuran dehydrogenase subunit C